ncbi:bifunctional hydroxymethylpyrimidine kinase/phosphomethylpyrimidine kinase [Nocardioides sp. InS609-2]|uniref:bifunctional hydroxymethylpyrimidine kinase/phosphomethylpyrimidine kinase n=1 Tax=Nocardioides sp. InS609-2 TaxID=2760705 RepID=UPI0020BF61DC|nr:bifunctional hydroxymethylpyrimidine kinase/phosphomethylpyrimidine kinase [Nocardioides sp. InS609-2]
MNPAVGLTIAGTDSGGAAGIAADLATFAAHGVHGACVVTAVTAQDTTGVRAVHPVPYEVVEAQIDAVLDDLPVAVVKTGMLGTADVVRLVADRLVRLTPGSDPVSGGRPGLVVDPVLVATSGAVLGDDEVIRAYLDHLLPVATVITPNIDEARALLGVDDTPAALSRRLAELGPAVVLTGGGSDIAACTDWVALPGLEPVPLPHLAVETTNDHGTGCTFSAALAAALAGGHPIPECVRRAAAYTTRQLHTSRTWTLGRGRGPVAHIQSPTEGEAP